MQIFIRKKKKNSLTSFSSFFKSFETKVFIKYRFLLLILTRVYSKDRQVVPAFKHSRIPFLYAHTSPVSFKIPHFPLPASTGFLRVNVPWGSPYPKASNSSLVLFGSRSQSSSAGPSGLSALLWFVRKYGCFWFSHNIILLFLDRSNLDSMALHLDSWHGWGNIREGE